MPNNVDATNRFEDWLISPREMLDLEVKGWLDFTSEENRGLVAKACIALANHGGGFLLFGYTRDGATFVPDEANRPSDLSDYGSDSINAIVTKNCEPSFHVDCHCLKHPTSLNQFPFFVIGGSDVPIRSKRSTAKGSLKQDCYYTRRSGPKSESPQTGAEWDALISRCVRKNRDRLLADISRIIGSDVSVALTGQVMQTAQGNPAPSSSNADVAKFARDSRVEWESKNASLANDHPAKISFGTFSFSCKITGKSLGRSAQEIKVAIQNLKRYTGWSILNALTDAANSPYLSGDVIEAWFAKGQLLDSAHADFWRVSTDGLFYLLRGYQEDVLERGSPGKLFDFTLPIWRVGEFLMRVAELGRFMYAPDFMLHVQCEWTGLRGRSLVCITGRHFGQGGGTAHVDSVTTQGSFSETQIPSALPEAVEQLVKPLLAHFDFFDIPSTVIRQELSEILSR